KSGNNRSFSILPADKSALTPTAAKSLITASSALSASNTVSSSTSSASISPVSSSQLFFHSLPSVQQFLLFGHKFCIYRPNVTGQIVRTEVLLFLSKDQMNQQPTLYWCKANTNTSIDYTNSLPNSPTNRVENLATSIRI